MAEPRLQLELVPRTAFNINLRKALTPDEWAACQRYAFDRHQRRCAICQGVGPRWPVECHEQWAYDEIAGVQRLSALVALCPACHEVVHMGLEAVRGREAAATAHLMRINGWTLAQAEAHKRKAFSQGARRSQQRWRLDAKLLTQLAIPLSPETCQQLSLSLANTA